MRGTWFGALGLAVRASTVWIERSNPRVRIQDTAEYIKSYQQLGCHPVRLTPLLSILICYFVVGRIFKMKPKTFKQDKLGKIILIISIVFVLLFIAMLIFKWLNNTEIFVPIFG